MFSLSLLADSQSNAVLLVRDLTGQNFGIRISQVEAVLGTQLTRVGLHVVDHKLLYEKFSQHGIDPYKVNESSANNIARSLGAQFVIMADMVDLAKTSKKFSGYGIKTNVLVQTLTVNVKISRSDTGETILSSTMSSSEKLSQSANMKTIDEQVAVNLFKGVSEKLASAFEDSNALLETVGEKVKNNRVLVRISSNVVGVVSVNGLVVGVTNSQIEVPAGINILKVERTNFGTFERNVNFYNGQVLNVDLELTERGFAIYRRDKLFDEQLNRLRQNLDLEKAERLAAIEIARIRTAGEIEAMVNVSKGRMDMLRSSRFNLDTQNLQEISIDPNGNGLPIQPINVINNSSQGGN
jgi:hypothetical protein